LFGERLLLALQCLALGKFALLLLPPRLLFALGPLLAQDLRIQLGDAACLLHSLGMGLAAQLLIVAGLCLAPLLSHPARLLITPRLLGTQGQLLAPGLLTLGLLFAPGLLNPAGGKLTPGLLGTLRLPFAFGLLGLHGDLLAPGLLGTLCLLLAPRLFGLHGDFFAPGLLRTLGDLLALGLLGTFRDLLAPCLFFDLRLLRASGLLRGGGRRSRGRSLRLLGCFCPCRPVYLGLLFAASLLIAALGALRLQALGLFLLGGLAFALFVGLLLSLDLDGLRWCGLRWCRGIALRRFAPCGFTFAGGALGGFGRSALRSVGDHLADLGTGRRGHMRRRGALVCEYAAAIRHRWRRHDLGIGQRVGRHAQPAAAHRPAPVKIFR
jgi:hypothetical protein